MRLRLELWLSLVSLDLRLIGLKLWLVPLELGRRLARLRWVRLRLRLARDLFQAVVLLAVVGEEGKADVVEIVGRRLLLSDDRGTRRLAGARMGWLGIAGRRGSYWDCRLWWIGCRAGVHSSGVDTG